MILRPYQQRIVANMAAALKKYGNSLAISPTGSGKTIMLPALAGNLNGAKTLILQHRDELVAQNLSKFQKVNPKIPVSLYTAGEKSWGGNATFAMVQTLSREHNLKTIPALDLLIIDEAHHSVAETYKRVIDRVKEQNGKAMIAGFTATPSRGDKKGLVKIFNNVADHISLRELVAKGFLVPPKAYVVDVEGASEKLKDVRKIAEEYEMDEVEKILNVQVVNDEVIAKWKEYAGDRKTIVFCSTVAHATDVLRAFVAAGVSAEMVTGETPDEIRKAMLCRLKTGATQVIVNVFVLTEGFDESSVSCIILLRPCSFKSTLIQMCGRGLRPVFQDEYPGLIKKDCIILDFGSSTAIHGNLDAGKDLMGIKSNGDAPMKECPECGMDVPLAMIECPICGYVFVEEDEGDGTGKVRIEVEKVVLREVDLLNASPFRWIDLFSTGKVMVASGFDAWVGVFSKDGENWYALGKEKTERQMHKLLIGDRVQALAAADDFLRQKETNETSRKSMAWMRHPASEAQLQRLRECGYDIGAMDLNWTKYNAAGHLTFQWNRWAIQSALS